MKTHPNKLKNNNYTPLDIPLDQKALYKQILAWTRSKQTFWYIGSQKKDYVCYILQGNDGYKIQLKHYLNKPPRFQYEFLNFPGYYSYQEYKDLEDAILDAGFKKPLSPSECKAKQKKKREKELTKKKTKLDFYTWNWVELREATFTGRCNWLYADVSDSARSFTTIINLRCRQK